MVMLDSHQSLLGGALWVFVPLLVTSALCAGYLCVYLVQARIIWQEGSSIEKMPS